MAYHTSMYLFIFLPIALLFYQLTPKKWRWCSLLLFGYAFFFKWSKVLIVFILATTLWVYGIGLLLGRMQDTCKQKAKELEKSQSKALKQSYKKKEKWILIIGILVLIAPLAYLKYYNFFAENVNLLVSKSADTAVLPMKELFLPIGISFYTLQAIGYITDVYWGKVKAERHIGKIALFLCFFPQIMEGPISLYSQTADQLWAGNSLTSENLKNGCIRIIWGLFKKLIIADRLYTVVVTLYDSGQEYHGVMIAVAAVAYAVQLYNEFSGSMDMIIGSGLMFGVVLPENFRQPFFSKNAAEFWRRWHITLGVWLKTYVFYPVSVSGLVKKWNKFGKAHCGKYVTKLGVSAMCLFPVWLFNGIWHGASWSYIFYGIFYFVILLLEIALEPARDFCLKKLHLDAEATCYKVFQTLKTWIIIFTGELFFRANTLQSGIKMFTSMFRQFEIYRLWDGTLLTLGIGWADYLAIGVGVVVVAIVGIVKEKNLLGDKGMLKFNIPMRWAIYYALIFAVLFFGAYGIGYQEVDLIYAGF